MESCISEACCFELCWSYLHTAVFHFIAPHHHIWLEAERSAWILTTFLFSVRLSAGYYKVHLNRGEQFIGRKRLEDREANAVTCEMIGPIVFSLSITCNILYHLSNQQTNTLLKILFKPYRTFHMQTDIQMETCSTTSALHAQYPASKQHTKSLPCWKVKERQIQRDKEWSLVQLVLTF